MDRKLLFAKIPLWLKDHPRNDEPFFVSLIAWMSIKAFEHGGSEVTFNGERIVLQCNQFISGVKQLTRLVFGYHYSDKKDGSDKQSAIRRALDRLSSDKLIVIQPTSVCSLYTLSWIDSCQTTDKPSVTQPANDRQTIVTEPTTNPDKERELKEDTLSVPPVPAETRGAKKIRRKSKPLDLPPIDEWTYDRVDVFIEYHKEEHPSMVLDREYQARALQSLLLAVPPYSKEEIVRVLKFIYKHQDGSFKWLDQVRSLAKLSEKPKAGSPFHEYDCWMDVFLDFAKGKRIA